MAGPTPPARGLATRAISALLELGARSWSAWQQRSDGSAAGAAPATPPPRTDAAPPAETPQRAPAGEAVPAPPGPSWAAAARAHLAHYEARIPIPAEPEADEVAGPSATAVRRRRIAIRRLRLVASWVDDGDDAPVDRALRRLGRGLGDVRDRDLASAAIREHVHACGDADLGALERAALDELQAWLEARRRRAVTRHASRDDAAAIDAALAALHRALEPWWTDEAHARSRVQQWYDDAVLALRERVAAAYDDLDVEPLHELRIAARRLRYGLEFAGELAPPGAASVLPWCRRLQSVIGRHRDHVLWQALLRRRIDRALAQRRYALARGLEPGRQAAQQARAAAWETLSQELASARGQLTVGASR